MRDWDLGFDLDKLQAFYAVTQLGGVGPAARALGRSQPAISHRLRALADGLGVPLFERVGRQLRPTPAGAALALQCAELFSLARNLPAAIRADDVIRGRVSIGTYATIASHVLAPLLDPLLAAHPELSLRFVFELAPPLLERLRRGDLDLVLIASSLRSTDGLDVHALTRDRMVAVAKPGFLPPRTPRLAALRAKRYLAWEGNDESYAKVRAWAEANTLIGDTTLVVPHLESLRRLALRGVGWAVLPRYTAADDLAAGLLVDLAPKGLDVTLDFHLVTRARSLPTAAVRAVRAVLEGARPGSIRARHGTSSPG